MKMTPAMKAAQENMKPGNITEEGFLGDERIPIVEMIVRDEGEMAAAGLSFDKTAELLRRLMDEGQRGLGEPVTIDDKWLIRVVDPRGQLPCPFEDGLFHKMTAEITNKSNDASLIVTDLSIHLLEAHHFIEGKGSKFRLDADKLNKVLFS